MSHHSSNPFASTHSDSDSDSVSCFVTDLFETRSSDRSRSCCCHDTNINPFSGVVCDLHNGELGLGFRTNTQNNEDRAFNFSVGDNSGGLRVVGFGSDSDSSSEEGEVDVGGDDDRAGGGFDDFDVRLCWDSLCLEDQRTLNEGFEWEEVEERVNERGDLSVVVDEVEIDGQSVASGFTNGGEDDDEELEPGEEALRYLEWEILLAVNNLERNGGVEHEGNADSYLAVPDGYIYTAEYDVLFGQFLENESALKGSPPAAKSVVENLPLVELTKEELQGKNVACAICKDEILSAEKVRRLPCSHCYHGDCILPWLSIRNTCPVCRFELPTDDPDYEQRKVRRAAHDLLELAAQMQF
ncbi:E3 ubiquitin-protein ligase CIP8-like [Abrus precatorius]|uniref:RING-type E3 ubiquitin transferase n=1 Tax=Abrus precatorius TaxID=3816 RepID=A0A8B8LNI3_ABRPR|nr:E3 ubiquitin-protein ligase CIP8-like [Abrus precatorius]